MNTDQIIILLISAALNGACIAVGMVIGTRQSAKAMRREMEIMIAQSETFQAIKTFITNQTLVEKATKFFEEATLQISSPEAKNFFKNAAELLKRFSQKQVRPIPTPKTKNQRDEKRLG